MYLNFSALAASIAVCVPLTLAAPAAAHDWYPSECCHERDCKPISAAEIEITAEGYRIRATGELIPYGQERKTPPEGGGRFHRCTYASGLTRKEDGKFCFYVPEFGS